MNRMKEYLLILLVSFLFYFPAYAQNNIPVTVKALEQLVFHPVKTAPAQVVTLQNSLLSSELSALVEEIYVQIGDVVVKDQLLIRLECDDYELNKEQLVAQKKALEAEQLFFSYQFERSKKLLKSKSVSQEAHRKQAMLVTKLSAQIQNLVSKIRQSEKMISRCKIKAPFSGVIAERLINIGETVSVHSPLLRLIDVDDLEVEVQVPIVVVDDLDYTALNFIYRNQPYPLKLRAIIPSIETRARHQRVRLSFIDNKALPDAYGVVEITLRAMHIPANILVTRNAQVGIFLYKSHKAHFYAIKGALIGRTAVINLPLNTQVIISGRNALSEGQTVSIPVPLEVQ